MDLGPHLDAILGDLEALAGADEATAANLERLSGPLEASIQIRLLDVLGEASLELGEQLSAGHVEVRVAGRDAGLVYVGAPQATEAPSEPAEDEGETTRLTLRMSDSLKTAVEAAATTDGVSVNAWLVRAVKRALDRPPERMRASGNRIKGYARS
jgi:HicB-like protein involved in pilus formation